LEGWNGWAEDLGRRLGLLAWTVGLLLPFFIFKTVFGFIFLFVLKHFKIFLIPEKYVFNCGMKRRE
jgi:hypothetical protein